MGLVRSFRPSRARRTRRRASAAVDGWDCHENCQCLGFGPPGKLASLVRVPPSPGMDCVMPNVVLLHDVSKHGNNFCRAFGMALRPPSPQGVIELEVLVVAMTRSLTGTTSCSWRMSLGLMSDTQYK